MIRHFAATTAVAFALIAGAAAFSPAAAQVTGEGSGNPDRTEKRAERLLKRFDRLDKNGDGAVDRDEIERQLTRVFARIDRNGDGSIDENEIKARSERRASRNGGGKNDRFARRMERADRNGDGRVTKDEFLDKLPMWFRRADENRDGRVTRAELEDFLANRKSGRGGRRGREDRDEE